MTFLSVLKKKSNMPRVFLGTFLSLLATCSLTFFSSSCRLSRLERRLDPMNAEFLSQVRYIITRKERKIFLELPASEKEAFQEEFWKIRDPDPETEENEFKMMYLERIETSNELFVSEGRPGWLTDRGRIYVLFGPPRDRITFPMGDNPWSRCQEIWYYGNFPVIFIDSTCTGQYKLVTYNLTELRSLNLMYMHEFSKAQDRALKAPKKAREFFDFKWRVKKEIIAENRAKAIIEIEIPYEAIWFKAEDEILKTVLDVQLELKDFEANIIWEYEEAFEIVIKDDELREKKGKNYKIEIPLMLNEELDRLRQGKNFLYAVVVNRTGNKEAKKVMEFRLGLANR